MFLEDLLFIKWQSRVIAEVSRNVTIFERKPDGFEKIKENKEASCKIPVFAYGKVDYVRQEVRRIWNINYLIIWPIRWI